MVLGGIPIRSGNRKHSVRYGHNVPAINYRIWYISLLCFLFSAELEVHHSRDRESCGKLPYSYVIIEEVNCIANFDTSFHDRCVFSDSSCFRTSDWN